MDRWEIFFPSQISHAKRGFRVVTESFSNILSYIYQSKTQRERERERERERKKYNDIIFTLGASRTLVGIFFKSYSEIYLFIIKNCLVKSTRSFSAILFTSSTLINIFKFF